MDLADKLFRGAATTPTMLRYFVFQTPQYVYYIIPMSALVATLVTVGLMTKNSELIVMRACGISLVPDGRAAAALCRRGERGAFRPAGARDGVFESRGRSTEPRHSRLAARKLRRAGPALGGRRERRHLSLRLLRREEKRVPVFDVYHLDPAEVGARRSRAPVAWPRPAGPRRTAVWRWDGRGSTDGRGSFRDDAGKSRRRPPSSTSRLPSGRCGSNLPATSRPTSPTPR